MKAYELISSPEKWTTFAGARDKDDERVLPDDPEACKWCALGAIQKCYDRPEDAIARAARYINSLRPKTSILNYRLTIAAYNDHSSHEKIVALLKHLNI